MRQRARELETGVPVEPRFLFLGVLLAGLLVTSFASGAEQTKQKCAANSESAQDLRRAGKLHEARASFAACTAASCPGPIREDCAQRLKDIEAAMPTVVLEAKNAAGHDLSAVRVTMDGTLLREELDGTAIAIDPGEHTFAFEASGFRKTEDTAVVREGERDRRVRVVLESLAPASGIARDAPRSVDRDPRRPLGLALGLAGGAGIAVGAVVGLVAKATYDNALQAECGGDPNRCTPQGTKDGQTAHSQATASTVALVAGGVLLAGGAVLYFTAPNGRDVTVAATVGHDGGGLAVTGRW
jgi:hypothetical protein